ncbi:hypothetical protein GUJ93_ZPchr0013g35908 [Zizania palustris]|uniref:Uncharacterized protein n=1 Tax=Zizania palustris TaxID=103762 RepID=A0A8J6BX33_ZIZPA|nr:hypothetical protein GUJ93_ZPchr0013g35908 [Zizania palustris]
MDVLDHTEDEEEEEAEAEAEEERQRIQCGGGGGGRGARRFGTRRQRRRASGHHRQVLLMDCVGNGKEGASEEETVPLPEYERLSQSARLPDDTDPLKSDAPPTPPPQEKQPQPIAPQAEWKAQKPAKQPPSPPRSHQQKPAAWRLIEYVRSRNKPGGPAAGCGSSDGDSKSSDGEKEAEKGGGGEEEEGSKDKKDKKKKRSSWLPDPDRRWPVQGFY